jgi:hypothetical protein
MLIMVNSLSLYLTRLKPMAKTELNNTLMDLIHSLPVRNELTLFANSSVYPDPVSLGIKMWLHRPPGTSAFDFKFWVRTQA